MKFSIDSVWLTLIASLSCMIMNGTNYAFGIYSEAIKSELGYNQKSLAMLTFSTCLGASATFFGGLVERIFGAQVTLTMSLCFVSFGYLMIWATLSHAVDSTFGYMCFYFALIGLGNGCMDMLCISINQKNFPQSKGIVTGICKALLGISASVLAGIYSCFFHPESVKFLLFLSFGLGSFTIACIPFIRPHLSAESHSHQKKFQQSVTALVILAVGLGTSSLSEPFFVQTAHEQMVRYSILCFVFIIMSYIVFLGFYTQPSTDYNMTFKPARKLNTTDRYFTELFYDPVFYMLFFCFFSGIGSGQMLISNCAQIIKARYGSLHLKSMIISVISSANCLGRLTCGYVSDKVDITRPQLLRLIFYGCAVSHLLLPSESDFFFSAGVFMCSFCYGGLWSVCPVMVGEIFGMKYLNLNYSVINLAQILSSLIISSYLPAFFYDYHSINGSCHGTHCFSSSHYLNCGILLFTIFLCDNIIEQTKHIYEPKDSDMSEIPKIV